jgi:hypothetical protein
MFLPFNAFLPFTLPPPGFSNARKEDTLNGVKYIQKRLNRNAVFYPISI